MFFKDEGESAENDFLDIYSTPVNINKSSHNQTRHTHRKPNISYADLIAEALENAKDGMLTLKDIYSSISSKYPYFSLSKAGWQNSIRHNLSLNKAFYKVPRAMGNPGKGSYWKINYDFYTHKQGYRSKRMSSRLCNRMNSDDCMLQQNFLEDIGVTEMVSKPSITSVFDGNLALLYENVESNDLNLDIKNPNQIFSFKK